jgi:predicted small secreted protein
MLNRRSAFRLVLLMLLLASLACNTIMGGGTRNEAEDAQATADAALTEAAEEFGDPQATADALATEAAEEFGDFATPEDEPEGEATEEDPVEEAPTEESGEIPGSGEGPEDIPVFDGNNQNFFATADVVTYTTDAPYADVVAFYRAEMEANGWTYNETLSTEFGEIAALTYEKDGRTATLSILTDTTNGGTLVAVNIQNS